jgi:hypothetical protein
MSMPAYSATAPTKSSADGCLKTSKPKIQILKRLSYMLFSSSMLQKIQIVLDSLAADRVSFMISPAQGAGVSEKARTSNLNKIRWSQCEHVGTSGAATIHSPDTSQFSWASANIVASARWEGTAGPGNRFNGLPFCRGR